MKKTVSIHYKEDADTKKWIDRNVGRKGQSAFIRMATKRSRDLLTKKK